MMRTTIVICLVAALALSLAAPTAVAKEGELAPILRGALVKVRVTSQGWDLNSPWNKASPRTYTQQGVMIRPGLVLTVQGGLNDCIMVEVSVANSSRRYPASLEHIDYGCGLALVKIDDEALAAEMAPLELGSPVTVDDEFEIWQLGGTNLLERSTARVQKVAASGPQLQLTVKTTFTESGAGQAALKDGKIVGLLRSTNRSRQEGTVIAEETIRKFLSDWEDGDYKGFGAGGLYVHPLLRDDLRAWFQVPDDAHGIGVSHIYPGRTGDGVLEEGDVITAIDGNDLDDEGMFDHPLHGRLSFIYLLQGKPQPGDELPATILRKGKPMSVKIPIRGWPLTEQVVPMVHFDRRPVYVIIGGLVILELHGRSRVGQELRQYVSQSRWNPPGDRKRIIYASRVLADKANKGLDEIRYVAIVTVNGKKITEIGDVAEALKTPVDGYHVITFESNEVPFVVKAAELEEVNQRVAERYGVSELSYLGE